MKREVRNIICWLLAAVLLPAIAGCGASSKAVRSARRAGKSAPTTISAEVDKTEAADTTTVQPGKPEKAGRDTTMTAPDSGRTMPPIRVLYGVPPAQYMKSE